MRGAKAELSGHVWLLCHLLVVMDGLLEWSSSGVNLEICCIPVSDPESSQPTACVGAEIASTHFSQGPAGLLGLGWKCGGRWEGRSAIT